MERNGYTNFETWIAAHWIDNDEGSQGMARELTRATLERARAGEYRSQHTPASLTDGDLARHRLADELRAWVEMTPEEGGFVPDIGSSLAADLLNGALSEIDYYDLARHFLSCEESECAYYAAKKAVQS